MGKANNAATNKPDIKPTNEENNDCADIRVSLDLRALTGFVVR
jgi:hypothetical protein